MTSVSVQHSEILGIATPGSRAFRVGGWRVEPGLGRISAGAIELGPHRGHKAFMLQTLPAAPAGEGERAALVRAAGFSVHAGVAAAAHQRDKLERLCRYVARPAVATERLSLTARGEVRYTLKTPLS